jgi:Protein of unknown function (DUF4007)
VKKAVDGATADPDLFNQDEAVVRLGIGKNMVRSLRFWGMAMKVLAELPRDTGRVSLIAPSSFGQAMFGDGGWDPYCELPGTLWLLHWSLLKPPSSAPVWWLAFNEFPAVEFTAEELQHFVSERTRDWSFTSDSAIKKDVLCLLRMYASGQSKRASFEDLVDCPFRELNLIQASTVTAGGYRFVTGAKPTLPSGIAAFACMDFIARSQTTAKVIGVNYLATEVGSPGRAFRLSEAELTLLLSEASGSYQLFELKSPVGVSQLTFRGDAASIAEDLLAAHYVNMGSHPTKSKEFAVAGSIADTAYTDNDQQMAIAQ